MISCFWCVCVATLANISQLWRRPLHTISNWQLFWGFLNYSTDRLLQKYHRIYNTLLPSPNFNQKSPLTICRATTFTTDCQYYSAYGDLHVRWDSESFWRSQRKSASAREHECKLIQIQTGHLGIIFVLTLTDIFYNPGAVGHRWTLGYRHLW